MTGALDQPGDVIVVAVAAAPDDEALLARLARHPDPEIQAFGRLLATPIGRDLHAFINAELAAGTPPVNIASAVTRLFGSVVGGIIVNTTVVDQRDVSAENFVIMFGRMITSHLDHAEGLHPGGATRQ